MRKIRLLAGDSDEWNTDTQSQQASLQGVVQNINFAGVFFLREREVITLGA